MPRCHLPRALSLWGILLVNAGYLVMLDHGKMSIPLRPSLESEAGAFDPLWFRSNECNVSRCSAEALLIKITSQLFSCHSPLLLHVVMFEFSSVGLCGAGDSSPVSFGPTLPFLNSAIARSVQQLKFEFWLVRFRSTPVSFNRRIVKAGPFIFSSLFRMLVMNVILTQTVNEVK